MRTRPDGGVEGCLPRGRVGIPGWDRRACICRRSSTADRWTGMYTISQERKSGHDERKLTPACSTTLCAALCAAPEKGRLGSRSSAHTVVGAGASPRRSRLFARGPAAPLSENVARQTRSPRAATSTSDGAQEARRLYIASQAAGACLCRHQTPVAGTSSACPAAWTPSSPALAQPARERLMTMTIARPSCAY